MPESTLTPAPVNTVALPKARKSATRFIATSKDIWGAFVAESKEIGILGTETRIREAKRRDKRTSEPRHRRHVMFIYRISRRFSTSRLQRSRKPEHILPVRQYESVFASNRVLHKRLWVVSIRQLGYLGSKVMAAIMFHYSVSFLPYTKGKLCSQIVVGERSTPQADVFLGGEDRPW